jgi:hypothetical protein
MVFPLKRCLQLTRNEACPAAVLTAPINSIARTSSHVSSFSGGDVSLTSRPLKSVIACRLIIEREFTIQVAFADSGLSPNRHSAATTTMTQSSVLLLAHFDALPIFADNISTLASTAALDFASDGMVAASCPSATSRAEEATTARASKFSSASAFAKMA